MNNYLDRIGILINNSYCDFIYSNFAINEYNRRKKILNKFWIPVNYEFEIDRSDETMIEICKEYGNLISDKFSDIIIKYIPKKYENYYIIVENDGKEEVIINYDKYISDHLRKELKSM